MTCYCEHWLSRQSRENADWWKRYFRRKKKLDAINAKIADCKSKEERYLAKSKTFDVEVYLRLVEASFPYYDKIAEMIEREEFA